MTGSLQIVSNISINPKLSSLISYSSVAQNDMTISLFKLSKGSGGDVLLTVNQICSGTLELLLLRGTLKTI